MDSTTQLSPLTLGPPRRLLPPPPGLPPPGESVALPRPPRVLGSVTLRARYFTESTITPPVIHKLNALAEFLKKPPTDSTYNKVIAVDGLDRSAVQLVIADLHYNITQDLHFTVRVLSEDPPQFPANEPVALTHFSRQIENWTSMWDVILQAPPPAPRVGTWPEHHQGPVPHASTASPHLCVWIIPLSPLMATVRASIGMALRNNYGSTDLWSWLASHWAGNFRPDVTVNIQEVADSSTKREVLRFEGNDTKTLVVTTVRDGDVHITTNQLERVTFEVKVWIRSNSLGRPRNDI